MGFDYKQLYDNAKEELDRLQLAKADLERQLAEVRAKIEALTQTVNATAPLVGEKPRPTLASILLEAGVDVLKEAGFTFNVRMILQASPDEPLSAPVIRERLEAQGWNLDATYAQPLATIHTVLRRLVDGKEVKEIAGLPDGKKYQWIGKRRKQKPEPVAPAGSRMR